MPPDHRTDDDDTQEHSQAPDYQPAPTAPAPEAGTGASASPDWSSQAGEQPAPWQQPSSQAGEQPAPWQQPISQAGEQPAPWQQPSGQPGQWPEQAQQGWGQQQPAQGSWQPQGGQPPAGWHQQPQPQAGWQQPPQWQQQGWGQAGYWPAAPEYPNNPLVVVSGIILIVFGVLTTLIGLFGMIVGSFAATFLEEYIPPEAALEFDIRAVTTVLLVVFGIVLVVGILHFLTAIGIFLHKGWARALGIILAVLGLLLGVVGAVGVAQEAASATEAGREAVVPIIVAVSYGLTLFALIAGGNHFRRRYG